MFAVCLFLHAERVDMQQASADVQGRKLNTALINSTIDRLNANGGGTLFFPAGTYLTGSIHMKSNITLELEAGATLKFRRTLTISSHMWKCVMGNHDEKVSNR